MRKLARVRNDKIQSFRLNKILVEERIVQADPRPAGALQGWSEIVEKAESMAAPMDELQQLPRQGIFIGRVIIQQTYGAAV